MDNNAALDLGFGEGMAIIVVSGVATLLLIVAILIARKGIRNMAKFWAEDERASTMPLSQFLFTYMAGSVFDAGSQPLYKESRDQFGLSIGILAIAIGFWMFGDAFLIEPLEEWFEEIPPNRR